MWGHLSAWVHVKPVSKPKTAGSFLFAWLAAWLSCVTDVLEILTWKFKRKWRFNSFSNIECWTRPNWRSLQTTFLNLMKMAESSAKWVDNTVGKGEIAHYEQFLLFSHYHQKTVTPDTWKQGLVWEKVNSTEMITSYMELPLSHKIFYKLALIFELIPDIVKNGQDVGYLHFSFSNKIVNLPKYSHFPTIISDFYIIFKYILPFL